MLMDKLRDRFPRFIFFSDFVNLLPFEIPLSAAHSNEAVRDFAKLAALDLKLLVDTEVKQRRRNILSQSAARLTGQFGAFYQQESLELRAEVDGEGLRFGVQETNGPLLFRTDQRSRGFQWFLSFFLRLNANGARDALILIDEPGLYLHARAQRDVLKVLEHLRQTTGTGVVFSTHSPYLIDPLCLHRVRLVERQEGRGTIVESKLHRASDKASLDPVLTAIGMDLGQGLSPLNKRVVLVEGPSDYFYLTGMGKLLGFGSDWAVISVNGAPKMPDNYYMFSGWGLDPIIVLDHDKEGRRTAAKLKRLGVDESRVVFVSDQTGGCVEDLFDLCDFHRNIIGKDPPESAPVNSVFVKGKDVDEVILAKVFRERVQAGRVNTADLAPSTLDAFRSLGARITAAISDEGRGDPPLVPEVKAGLSRQVEVK